MRSKMQSMIVAGLICLGFMGQASAKITVSFHLGNASSSIANEITNSVNAAIKYYHDYGGDFVKQLNVYYDPGVPTANANWNGTINFGGSRNTRTAMHEMMHTLGCGTHSRYHDLMTGGTWDGYKANTLIKNWGQGETLRGDSQHVWPYGLNFDTEDSETARQRCVKIMRAMQEDMGIWPTQVAYYYLVNRGTGMKLDGYGRTGNGSDLAQYGSTTHVNAQWMLVAVGSDYWYFVNRGTGMKIDGYGRTGNGSACAQYSGSTTHVNAQWKLQSTGDYRYIINRGTGMKLDGYGRTNNGAVCAQYSGHTTHYNAQWKLVRAN